MSAWRWGLDRVVDRALAVSTVSMLRGTAQRGLVAFSSGFVNPERRSRGGRAPRDVQRAT
jgi:hypothetical protein